MMLQNKKQSVLSYAAIILSVPAELDYNCK